MASLLLETSSLSVVMSCHVTTLVALREAEHSKKEQSRQTGLHACDHRCFGLLRLLWKYAWKVLTLPCSSVTC